MAAKICEHLESFELIVSDKYYCEECVKTGDKWVHLRTCQTCGAVLCCDNSPNKHARKHFHEAGHPVIISDEPGERWAWCYVDEQFARY